MQMRIVNVEKLFSYDVFRNKKMNFAIRVSDGVIDENNGIFVIKTVGGVRKVYKSEEQNIRIDKSYDIKSLGEAFFCGKYPFKKLKTLFMDKY